MDRMMLMIDVVNIVNVVVMYIRSNKISDVDVVFLVWVRADRDTVAAGCAWNCILYDKLGCWGLTWTYQKLKNWRIGTLEAPRQLPTTSERSSSLLSVAWKA